MEEKNAIIRDTTITSADYGMLTGSLTLEYGGGSVQAFGMYTLYNPHYKEDKNFGGFFIWRCMQIAGVSDWSRMKGKSIRVRIGENRLIHSIGNIIEDKWFCPEEEYETFR